MLCDLLQLYNNNNKKTKNIFFLNNFFPSLAFSILKIRVILSRNPVMF